MKPTRLVALALITVALPSLAHAKPVTSEDLVKAQENAGEWLTYGRDYRNWRYSPLKEITPDNAAKLSPVWAMSTGGKFGLAGARIRKSTDHYQFPPPAVHPAQCPNRTWRFAQGISG